MSQIQKTHLFGEMDLNLQDTPNKIYEEAFRISEDCGYMVEQNTQGNKDLLRLYSQDYDRVKIYFKNKKAVKVERSDDEGKNWETLNFNENMFEVNKQTLLNYKNKINFQKLTKDLNLPLSQGMLIKTVIEKYKMPVIAVGYQLDLIGIETKKQFMIWKDIGSHAEFLGLINKDGSDPK